MSFEQIYSKCDEVVTGKKNKENGLNWPSREGELSGDELFSPFTLAVLRRSSSRVFRSAPWKFKILNCDQN